jgi:hypothetical protein
MLPVLLLLLVSRTMVWVMAWPLLPLLLEGIAAQALPPRLLGVVRVLGGGLVGVLRGRRRPVGLELLHRRMPRVGLAAQAR